MKKNLLILFFLSLFLTNTTIAAVTVTTATGGSAISADDQGGSYTSLAGPVITEALNGEIGTGTVILDAPAGVIFDVGGIAPTVLMNRVLGNGGSSRNINGVADGTAMAITSITTTQITLAITVASNAGVTCKLTWQDVRVRPNTGAVATGNITTSGTSVITGITSGSTNMGTIAVVAGVFAKMQLLVPGESASPGAGTGKTGTPTAQTAGSVFSFTVNAVDANWNVVSSTNTVAITSSDVNATLPSDAALVAGTKSFSITLNTAGTKTVTATNYTDPAKTANTSPSITVNVGAFSKLQLLMPGETASPGASTGKTGTPSAQTAGSAVTVTVNAVDANWNLVNSITDNIGITSSDASATLPSNAVLVAGTKTYSVTFKTAGSATVTATDVTDGAKTANTSPSTTVNAGAFSKMQVLVPGETAAPGTVTGKTGTPSAQNLGTAFLVTVNAVDANWNLVSSTNTIGITSSDGAATLPSNAALVAGTKTYSITLNTSGSATVTATNISDGTKTANTSPSISIVLSVLVTATGGSAISADNTGGTYSSLTGPSFTEGANGDVGTGTIILNAPSGVIFDVGGTAPTLLMNRVGGSGANALNINGLADGATIALTAITTSQITFTISTASSSGVTCKLTFQNVRVRANTGAAGSGTLTKTGTSVMSGVTNSVTSFGTMTVVAGAFSKMQLLVPGETASPGAGSGKTGSPSAQTAGTAFNVTVKGVDAYWNVVSTTNTVGITSTDVNATLPGNAALAAGTQTFSVILNTVGTATVTATNITDGTRTANTSPSITVNAGAFTKLQILLPGETAAAGTATGKTGTPNAQASGASITVTVNAVDDVWNIVSSTHTVGITSSDANATLPANTALVAGSNTFNITLKTAANTTVTATNITDGTKTANTSPSVTVSAGAFSKMQILVPGETAAPGSATGKTGVPNTQSVTRSFAVTVNAVDANWNLVSSTNTVGITSSDGAATLPGNAALVAGTNTYSITLNTVGTPTITATNITDGTKTANTSPSITTALSILTPATGGSSISADNTGGTWTTLTGPICDEATSGDVGAGTIILNAPAGLIFDVGGVAPTVLMTRLAGAGADTRNINSLATGVSFAITSITTSQITVTITSASNNGATCRLTWQNIRVRPNTGITATGNITKTGTAVLTGVSGSTNIGTLTVVAGVFAKMQLLVPGETAAPGVVGGKTGTPTAQTAGTAFNVTVNSVDANWNVVSSTNTVGITSSDVNATLPSNAALVAGTQTFSVTLKTGGSRTITGTNITDGTKTANTSPSITVSAGLCAKMQLLLPGETAAPGTVSGKTGTTTAATAGSLFSVTANAVDANWNVVTSCNNTVSITSSDVNATLPANAALVSGTKSFSVTLNTAGTKTITTTNVTDGTKTADTSPSTTVNAGAFAKMQILVPGESADPGSATGKTGTPSGQTDAIAFSVTVKAVDANWNLVSSTNTVGITSTDGTATLPGNAALVAGTQTYSITLNGMGDFTITATNITDGTKTANTSPAITVGPITWTGGAGTANWGDATNWSPAGVPTSTNNLNLTGANSIQINVAAACNNLTLNNSNLILTILSGNSLTVSGNLTHTSGTLTVQASFPTVTGTVSIAGGTVEYTAAGAQTISAQNYNNLTLGNSGAKTFASGTTSILGNYTLSGSATSDATTNSTTLNFNGGTAQTISGTNTFNNITINNASGVSISSGAQNIIGTLTLTAGALTTNGNTLTLISNASGTAQVDGSGTGTVSGNVDMQRYITGAAGYRYLGSPLSGATIGELQPDIRLDGMTGVSLPGRTNYWCNIYNYNEAATGAFANGWGAETAISSALTLGKGYAVYLYATTTFPLTITIQGTVARGAKTLPVSYRNNGDTDQGWSFVSNPYPSTIDWDAASGWTRTNIQGNTYYAWDNAAQQYASYPAGGPGVNGGTRYLASSQGFFVRTSGAGPALNMTESVKVSNNPSFWKTETEKPLSFKIKLSSTVTAYSDESVIRFINGATANRDDNYDAYKIASTNDKVPYVATVSTDTSALCINTLSELSNDISIPVEVKAGIAGTYKLSLSDIGELPLNTCLLLEDLDNGNIINLNKNAYSFSLPASSVNAKAQQKFILHISPPVFNISKTDESCKKGSIILKSRGTGSWSYTLNDNAGNIVRSVNSILDNDTIDNLSEGTYYIVSSKENSTFCNFKKDTVTIKKLSPITYSISGTKASCKGSGNGSIQIKPSGGTNDYSFAWSNGSTNQNQYNLKPGTYSVSISDNAKCNEIASYTVTDSDSAVYASIKTDRDTVYLSSGSAAVKFTSTSTTAAVCHWDFGDKNSAVSSSPVHYYQAPGIYTVKLKASNTSCIDSSMKALVVLESPSGVKQHEKHNINTYLSGNYIVIEPKSSLSENFDVLIYNLLGQPVYKLDNINANANRIQIHFGGYPEGFYLIHFISNHKTIGVKKISVYRQ